MLILFIFAILGVELFGRIQCNHNSQCHSIDKHVNFENSGMAMLTLFRITTGDNWSGIMKVHFNIKLLFVRLRTEEKIFVLGRFVTQEVIGHGRQLFPVNHCYWIFHYIRSFDAIRSHQYSDSSSSEEP